MICSPVLCLLRKGNTGLSDIKDKNPLKTMAKKNIEVKGKMLSYSIVIYKEGSEYVALAPEFDVACQAGSVEEAKELLKEAVELYISHPKARMLTVDFVAVATDIIGSDSIGMNSHAAKRELACQ